ncbi:DNA-binding protein [Deltaproteobacteria bacterium Smac51]|nr:DNA-binding protein [Deltaproteobacteria bacterium Smac51]
MAIKLPLRFSILYVLNKAGNQSLTTKEIYEQLSKEYEGEGQFSLDKMENHLMAVKATGIIEAREAYFDEAGEARYKYAITDYGRTRTKYLPPELQN